MCKMKVEYYCILQRSSIFGFAHFQIFKLILSFQRSGTAHNFGKLGGDGSLAGTVVRYF